MDHPAAPGDIVQEYQKYRFDLMKRGLFASILASSFCGHYLFWRINGTVPLMHEEL